MLLVDRVKRYLELTKLAKEVENEKRGIANWFKTNLAVILEARELNPEEKVLTFVMNHIMEYKVCEKTRGNGYACDLEVLKRDFPEAYAATVTKRPDCSYIEMRERRIQTQPPASA